MSQRDKAAYYQALKKAGISFDRHYREYTESELKAAYDRLAEAGQAPPLEYKDSPAPQQPSLPDPDAAAFFGYDVPRQPAPPLREKDPNELAGARLNTKDPDEPIRVDDQGRIWYQEEIRKPAYPKPRGRRKLTYMDPGARTTTVRNGEYQESFEIAGDPANARPAEVKITLPSYQVGIYKDPRFPFKVVTYNGNQGFDLRDVQRYYGGAELVPAGVKRKYVENVLCYDIRSVVRAIQDEHRALQLTGRIR